MQVFFPRYRPAQQRSGMCRAERASENGAIFDREHQPAGGRIIGVLGAHAPVEIAPVAQQLDIAVSSARASADGRDFDHRVGYAVKHGLLLANIE